MPAGKNAVANCARPPATGTVASGEPPSRKVTEPETVPGPDTEAVSVTLDRNGDGFALASSETADVSAAYTVCAIALESLPVLVPPVPVSPPYVAVIVCAPMESVFTVIRATPSTMGCAVPRFTPPSLNCTVPVGLLPVTVALKVTNSPEDELEGPAR